MRAAVFLPRVLAALAVLVLCGCAGTGGESSALARSTKSDALAALHKPKLGSKNPFTSLPKRPARSLAIAGDSLSIGLASEMEKTLTEKPGIRVAKLGKVSSGLARPDFYDWNRHMDELMRQFHPDAVVVMIGANDNKRMTARDGSQIHYGTKEWDTAYKERVRRILGIIRSHNPSATVFWLGAPVMADETLSRDLRHINALVRRVMAANRDCHYVDTWDLFAAPGGGFTFSKPDVEQGATLRTRDGVHLTADGSRALAARCLTALETRLTWSDAGSSPVKTARASL